MARRIRTIKPELWDDEGFGTLPMGARVLFVGILSESDDDGRFRAHHAHLKYACFKFDDTTPAQVSLWLSDIVATGMVTLYTNHQQSYGCVMHWHRHQWLAHRQDSLLPAPPPETAKRRAPMETRQGPKVIKRTPCLFDANSVATSAAPVPHKCRTSAGHGSYTTEGISAGLDTAISAGPVSCTVPLGSGSGSGSGKDLDRSPPEIYVAPPQTPGATAVGQQEASVSLFDGSEAQTVISIAPRLPGGAMERRARVLSADIDAVISHYRLKHQRAMPAEKERKLIAERMREGYSVEDLCLAIDGCHVSPHHCGKNSLGKRYQSLALIVRDSAHVADFIEHAEKPPLRPVNSREPTAERYINEGIDQLAELESMQRSIDGSATEEIVDTDHRLIPSACADDER